MEAKALPRLIVASNNANKLREFEAILGHCYRIVSMREAGLDVDIEENGTTFEENAMIKAQAAAKSGYPGIGDDSGLVVPALDMEPGIYSARYAGEHGNDAANNALLLENLKDEENRRAAFVCAFACVFPDGREPIVAEGRTEGVILKEPRGEGGFGYDPLFYYAPFGKTFAELDGEEKNSISHRGAAVAAFAERFLHQAD